MRSGHAVTSKTPVDSQAIANALKRFVYAGGDRILLDVLGSDDPAWLEGLDLRVLQRARTLYNVACSGRAGRLPDALRVRALDGKTALTDEEWRAAAPLIDPRVALGPGDPDGPEVRDLIEAVLLKLRTKVPWWKLPDRFGDPDVLYGLVRRLVRSGSWAGLFDLWCREHPHLVEGLDAGPLDRLQRGWPRFGHGEAGLTRRRKRRIAEVAAMPKGDGA
jgi:transposase